MNHANDHTSNPSLSNILHNSVHIKSHTIIDMDGKVQSYCGLKISDIPAQETGVVPPSDSNQIGLTEQHTTSTSINQPTATRKRPRGRPRIHVSKNILRGAARTSSGVPVSYNHVGSPSYQCRNCSATMWYAERSCKDKRIVNPNFSICCQDGKVLLPRFNQTPPPLDKLLDYEDSTTSKFRDQIRIYNGMFCFTSFGARIDHSVNTGRGLYTFRINGQNYHRIGSLLPAPFGQPRYAQLYFFDTQNEARNRMAAFVDGDAGDKLDETIVTNFMSMLHHYSAVTKAFRMARDWCHSHASVNFELRLISERRAPREYNAPTVAEVAALITNDFGDGISLRDIVVNTKNSGPQQISELHPSYMALQYPLLFPFREDGFYENIPYHNNKGSRKTNLPFVTMKEYYGYVIQQRNNQGYTLLKGGRLYQQYLVDAYTAVKEQRLKWTRSNQDTLRVDLYHNLQDAVTRGDTDAMGLGKRIVLPSSFTGGPRYMMQNYQDVMALCRAYGNPYLFITFTSNPKWHEIAEMLATFPGQKPHDRPEIGSRVFKMKLTELLDDLTKKNVFGVSHAVNQYHVI